ncbi:MAG: rod shape-determining protein MreD [Clostridia bacterium]|nr:rod shape-determining protein MreD [Clostridia bacterium]
MTWRVTFDQDAKNSFLKPLSNEKKYKLTSRIVFVLLIIFAALLQNTPHMFPTILGTHAFLLLPLVMCITMFQHNGYTLAIAAFAGALWDMSSGFLDGFNTLFFTLVAIAVGFLMNYLFRNNILTALLLSGTGILLYVLIYWLIFIVLRSVDGAGYLLLTFYLPSALYTFAFTPLFYIAIRGILRGLRGRFPKREVFNEDY